MNPNQAIYVTDFISLLIMSMILICNHNRLFRKQEENYHILLCLLFSLISLIGCTFAYRYSGSVEERPILVTAFQTVVFISNTAISLCWAFFLQNHLNGRPSIIKRILLSLPLLIVFILMMINLKFPFVFRMEGSTYYRLYGYYIIFAIDALYIAYSIALYIISVHSGGFLKFFPVWAFLLPILIGFTIQSFLFGVSLEVPCILIGIVGVLFSLQNETIYRDELTGLFNRAYLERLQEHIKSKNKSSFYGIMMDINDFKSINDTYGHKEGDEALRRFSILLKQGVGKEGASIRYAGDEFIAILNTTKEEEVKDCIERVDRLLEEEKKIFKKPYDISVAYGYDKYDSEKMSCDAFMKHIDEEMYAAKAQYYDNHPEKDRRSSSR